MMIIHPTRALFASTTSTETEVLDVLTKCAVLLELRLHVVVTCIESYAQDFWSNTRRRCDARHCGVKDHDGLVRVWVEGVDVCSNERLP